MGSEDDSLCIQLRFEENNQREIRFAADHFTLAALHFKQKDSGKLGPLASLDWSRVGTEPLF